MTVSTFRIRAARLAAQAATCSALWVLSTPAAAQQATPPANPNPPSTETSAPTQGNDGIPDIVVTAQRRSENLQNVPISVTAITSDALLARGTLGTRDIIAAVPAVTIIMGTGYLQPRIRGVGNTAVGPGFEGGSAIYVDGVYQAAPQANLFSLANIDRVEVLKGPQGTLFGRNTTGGLIQIITREPSETLGGNASFTAANYDDYTGDLYLTGGLAPGVALNFTGHAEFQGDGWGTNQYNGKDAYRVYHDIALRSSLLVTPAPGTKIRITGDYENNHSNINQSQKLAPGTGFPYPGLVQPVGNAWNINEDIQPIARIWSYGISANVSQDLGFASLVSISAYRKSEFDLFFDGDTSNLAYSNLSVTQPDRQFSQELQLTSNASSTIKWVVGAFYFDASSRFNPNSISLAGPMQPTTPGGKVSGVTTYDTVSTRSLAGYAQATVPIFDATNLTLGFRYTSERKKITDITAMTQIVGRPAPSVTHPADQSVTYNRPTWRVSLDHRFSPEVMIYASYNRGFKSGGFNGQAPTAAPFLPEEIDAYEVGLKTDLLDRHLRFNASAFYYDYTNIQVNRFVTGQQIIYNGAAARIYGLDVDFEARLTRNFSLSGGVTLLDDRFTSFPSAIISTQVPTGVIVTSGSAKGNRLPATADFSGTMTATYRVPTKIGEASFDVSYTYNDGYYTQVDNILRQPAYNLLAFGAGVTLHNGVSVRTWMRNALNTKIYGALTAGSTSSGANLQAPRTYGITLGAKF